jgi:hypothetical protein
MIDTLELTIYCDKCGKVLNIWESDIESPYNISIPSLIKKAGWSITIRKETKTLPLSPRSLLSQQFWKTLCPKCVTKYKNKE